MTKRAGMMQQQLKLNSLLLTELYREYGVMRSERKKYNEKADDYAQSALKADAEEDYCKAGNLQYLSNEYGEQASIFTPYIRKLRKRIASLEAIQKALKHELKCAQCLAIWTQEDDEFWQQQAAIAQEEGYTWSGNAQEFLANFGEV